MHPTVAVASSLAPTASEAVKDLVRAFEPLAPQLVLVFHSPRHDPVEMAHALARAFPQARTAGCTSTGEIASGRLLRGAVSAMAFGGGAQASIVSIPDLNTWHYDEAPAVLGRLADAQGRAPATLSPEQDLLLVLADGLSGGDELLVVALREVAPHIHLVGGSAADDDAFQQTWTFCDGVARPASAQVILLRPAVPFQVFNVHHFHSRGDKVVITRSDPARRRVSGLDGWPAVDGFARVCGVDAGRLQADPGLAASQPVQLALRTPGGLQVRGVMTCREQELVMACALEEGAILDVVVGQDLVQRTRDGMAAVLEEMGAPPQALLLFNCGGRVTSARRTGELEEMGRAMCPVPAAGFSTYGELIDDRLVNFSLAGVAFGAPAAVGAGGMPRG